MCFHFSMVTRKFTMLFKKKLKQASEDVFRNENDNMVKPHGLLVLVS